MKSIKLRNIVAFIVHNHHALARHFIVAMAVIIIFFIFPRKQFGYDFELGKPWLYKDLYAPFKFTIAKQADSLAVEKQRIIGGFIPYYQTDTTVALDARRRLVANYQSQFKVLKNDSISGTKFNKNDSIKFANNAIVLLESVYAIGIIDPSACKQNALTDETSGLLSQINLMEGNKATPRNTDDFFTSIPDACQYISNRNVALPNVFKKMVCEQLRYNIQCNKALTDKALSTQIGNVFETEGVVQQNEEIIRQGVIVQPLHYQKLLSLKQAYETAVFSGRSTDMLNHYGVNIGYMLLTLLIISALMLFIQTFHRAIFDNLFSLSFILGNIVIFLIIARFTSELQQSSNATLSLYVLPYCVVPIIMRNFFGTSVAQYVHITTVLLASFVVPMSYEFSSMQTLVGLTAITLNERTYYWSQFFIDTAIIFLIYELSYVSIILIQEGSLKGIALINVGWLVINCFLTLLTYPLISIFERLFGFVSDITLAELSYLNNPLLQELSHKAPGTFWHSLQVATLAEAASTAIGANALLTKVGALYHDIGKTLRPGYFIENQKTETNPHDDLPYIQSAQIIKAHVIDGIDLARQNGLPTIIADFIRTHHGTSRMEYFYYHYIKENPNADADEKLFRYPGPLPYSKETAVVMMADSIEAACRSLKNPNDEDINRLVDSIIDSKIRFNQFANCPLSFKDITVVRKVFKKQLRSLYHVRISYPEMDKVN